VTTPSHGDRTPNGWQTFVEHRPGTLIEGVDLFRGFAVLVEKSEALNRLRFYRFATGEWNSPTFSEPVYAAFPTETPDFNATEYRYSYQSFITPPSVFDYDPESGSSTLLKKQQVLGGYNPSDYETERLWATAIDGAKIPISIVSKKGRVSDGRAPLLLYGYGSYGIGIAPTFSLARLSLLDRGVSYAIAHIRGGDELGERWREDGMLMKKKNTFQDFIDCAEFLIRERWTSPDCLAIEGGSAGGLLMGVVANMRPDLFRAVHLAVPFVDVINTMLDATLPLTVGEYLEWGNPQEKPAYEYMKSYSPYDNLEKKAYPAILVTTSLHDSQVMYWEPAKYVAKLRTLKTDPHPLLLKIKMQPSGHGGASGRYDRLKDAAFEFAWLLDQIGVHE
jgi:oligopeptidase B